MELVFTSNNQHKIDEIKILLPAGIKLLSLIDINCKEELPETQATIEGNALQKAKYVFDNYKIPCFADDTGLEIDALQGRPGIYSARYAGEQKNALDNMNKVLNELKGVDNRKSYFKTVIAFINKDAKEFLFEGKVEGKITNEIKGSKGFGYDPIFQPLGYDITFAEMDMNTKNGVSHRARAVSKLIGYLLGIHGKNTFGY